MMPGSRITWIIGGAVVVLIVVAGVDALRSPEDEATASPATPATTQPFSPTTTVVTAMEDEAGEGNNFVLNQDPEDIVDEAGNPLPACSQDQIGVAIPPVSDPEGDGFFGLLLVRGPDDCRQGYPYFRVALRDSRGQQLLVWSGRLLHTPDPDAADPTLARFGPVPCQSWEVFPAFVTVGYERSPGGASVPPRGALPTTPRTRIADTRPRQRLVLWLLLAINRGGSCSEARPGFPRFHQGSAIPNDPELTDRVGVPIG